MAATEPHSAAALPPTTPKSSSSSNLGPPDNGSAEAGPPPVRTQNPSASTGASDTTSNGTEEDVATVTATLTNPTAAGKTATAEQKCALCVDACCRADPLVVSISINRLPLSCPVLSCPVLSCVVSVATLRLPWQ